MFIVANKPFEIEPGYKVLSTWYIVAQIKRVTTLHLNGIEQRYLKNKNTGKKGSRF